MREPPAAGRPSRGVRHPDGQDLQACGTGWNRRSRFSASCIKARWRLCCLILEVRMEVTTAVAVARTVTAIADIVSRVKVGDLGLWPLAPGAQGAWAMVGSSAGPRLR